MEVKIQQVQEVEYPKFRWGFQSSARPGQGEEGGCEHGQTELEAIQLLAKSVT